MALKKADSETAVESQIPNWGWLLVGRSGVLALNKRGPDEIALQLDQHLVNCSFRPFRSRETRLAGSRIRNVSAHSGACEVAPAGADFWARWHQDKEVATFTINSRWLTEFAAEEFGLAATALHADALPVFDNELYTMAGMFREEVRLSAGMLSNMYAEAFFVLLGAHLLRRYSNVPASMRAAPSSAVIAGRSLSAVVAYMHDNLAKKIRVVDLAQVAGLPPEYFMRAFKAATGSTPHTYLMTLRLAKAEQLLRTSSLPIVDIAMQTGFSQQSHLTAAMRRHRNNTPLVYRKRNKVNG